MRQMPLSSMIFGRSDVAEVLGIEEWRVANFASRRYPYGLRPSIRTRTGRRGLYALEDVYKIGLTYRLFLAGLRSTIVADTLSEVLREREPGQFFIDDRADIEDHAGSRLLILDLGTERKKRGWADTVPRAGLHSYFDFTRTAKRTPDTFFVMPLDELLHEIDNRILGRPTLPET